MNSLVAVKVTGLQAIEEQLLDLGAEFGAKLLAQSARKAFKPVLDAAIAACPVDTGDLRAAIKVRVTKPESGDTIVSVGIRITSGKGKGKIPPSKRWHWIEFGTVHQAAHPFLRPALEANAQAVADLLTVELRSKIDKAIRKRARAAA